MGRNLATLGRLMLVTDDRLLAARDPVAVCLAAERGGVTAVQLRLKLPGGRELAGMARALLGRLRIPVIINDRVDVAIAVGAAGVHLGPDDLPASRCRRLAPPGFLIGVSVGGEAELANGESADYWGIGPWAGTPTKPDAGVPLGATGFSGLLARAGDRPCFAIGGITPADVPAVLAAGGWGVAVVSGILAAADVEQSARAYARALA